jgi:hypothetical protein
MSYNPVQKDPFAPIADRIEAEWMKPRLRPIRYEVIVHSKTEPLMGTIVTELPLDAYCQEHGLVLMVCHSKRLAIPGEETDLI